VQSNFTNDRRSCGVVLGSLSARWPRVQIFNNFSAAEAASRAVDPFVPRQVIVVRNGLDLAHFNQVNLPTSGTACILGVGSLLPIKRWERLLSAAAQLKKRGLEFQIQIAGDGPMREELETQIRILEVMDRIELLGYSADVAALMAKATFLVHTSDIEGCPNAVVEAMASGRAVIATDAGDIRFLVDDGKTGFIVERGDDSKLVDRIATLIADRDLCAEMGRAGRKKAEREFGVSRLLRETFAAYTAAGWMDGQ
jgi:glycosyltransferase involved in cell wall biosynthesis